MDGVWTAAVGVVFALWWLASAMHQFAPRWWMRVVRYDPLRLLPQWHFFAPRPGRHDHHLLIRDLVDGDSSGWREVDIGEASPAWRWLWNPSRFRQKALVDLVNHLSKTRRELVDKELGARSEELTLPYLGLLAWAEAQPGDHTGSLRQFAIVASQGHGEQRRLRVLYLSDLHTVAGLTR